MSSATDEPDWELATDNEDLCQAVGRAVARGSGGAVDAEDGRQQALIYLALHPGELLEALEEFGEEEGRRVWVSNARKRVRQVNKRQIAAYYEVASLEQLMEAGRGE